MTIKKMKPSKNNLREYGYKYLTQEKIENDTKGMSKHYEGLIQASREYNNIESNISIRSGFRREDYEYFRQEETVPKRKKEIIRACMEAYRKIGIVRNIIDLMGDFCVQGIKIVHSNKQRQKFLRSWAKKVKFKEVSERFANLLFRAGNVVVRRTTAKLPAREEDRMTAQGNDKIIPNDNVEFKSQEIEKRTIPFGYTFLNPLSLEIIGGELGQFTGKQLVALKLTAGIQKLIKTPTNEEHDFLAFIPEFIKNAVKAGKSLIPLEQEKLYVSHYKKDDWQVWADPMTYSILDDLILLEKMKLADLSALDGAISQIRIWKLGDKDKGIFASEEQYSRLNSILSSNPGGGAFDIMWDAFIECDVINSEVYKFLGEEKYKPVLSSIFAGLGVPQTLTGSSTGGSGTTNNFISIQTMVQRLEYVRGKIRDFWENELALLQKSLGFTEPARISFDIMTLSDETTQKKLMIELWDRHLLSDEAIVEVFKEHPEIEIIRQRREERERKRNLRLQKTGPYFPTDKVHEYAKIALQGGYITPEDVGIERVSEEDTPFDLQLELDKEAQKNKVATSIPKKGVSGQGRPAGKKDSSKRKPKKFAVRTSAGTEESEDSGAVTSDFIVKHVWAREALASISELVNPIMLKLYNKTYVRDLTSKEIESAEMVKFAVLANLQPYQTVSNEDVVSILKNKCTLPVEYKGMYDRLIFSAYSSTKKELGLSEKRNIQGAVFALLN